MIKMDALRKLFEGIGCQNVQTYIQSGNVVFQYKKVNTKELGIKIHREIKKKFDFEVPVMIMDFEEIKQIVNANPFIKDKTKDIAYLHVTFLSVKPFLGLYKAINENSFLPDEFKLIDNAIYLYCPRGYSNSKLTNTFFEKKMQVTATTRNWKTTKELYRMAEKIDTA